MALSKVMVETIIALAKKGGMSNRAIAKEVGVGNKTVGRILEKHGIEKDSILKLARKEVENIAEKKAINDTKDTFNDTERHIYEEVFYDVVKATDLHLSLNTMILEKLNTAVEAGVKETKVNVGDGMQSIDKIDLNPTDYLNIAKASQTATDNLGITKRHANGTAIQVNNTTTTKEGDIFTEVMDDGVHNSQDAQIAYDKLVRKL